MKTRTFIVAAVAAAVVASRGASGAVWGLGAHVIKTGLAPVLIDLMERGFVSAIATNGAAVNKNSHRFRAAATSPSLSKSQLSNIGTPIATSSN